MYIAFFEVIAIVWFYGNTRYTDDLVTNQFFICIGAKRLVRNVKEMTGKEPHVFFIICWYAVAPSLILVRVKSFLMIIRSESLRLREIVSK